MSEVLSTLFSLNLGGGLAAVLLAAISRVKRVRIGAGWRCVLWAVLCLRLAVPVSLGFPALIRLPVPVVEVPAGTTAPAVSGNSGEDAATPPVDGATLPYESLPASGPMTTEGSQGVPTLPGPISGEKRAVRVSAVGIVFLVWAVGAAGVGAWVLGGHLRFLRYRRRWAESVEDPETLACFDRLAEELGLRRRPRLTRCPGLRSPMLAGIWRPVLLLPEEPMPPRELRFALLHELTHYRRRDLWLRALTLWVNVLHWFDPLMWLLVRWVERDMELACDDRVLRVLPPEEYRAYGSILLKLASNNKSN